MSSSLLIPVAAHKAGNSSAHIAAVAIAPTRRSGHGDTAWSLRTDPARLRQPQDGAPDSRARLTTLRLRPQIGLLQEPEDATLTGGTRSLTRRLLGLNVGTKRMTPSTVAGPAAQAKVA
jgi:hypothetical protein